MSGHRKGQGWIFFFNRLGCLFNCEDHYFHFHIFFSVVVLDGGFDGGRGY